MSRRSYVRLATFLFAIIAILQFIRAVGGWAIVINGTVSVPVWASWIACIVFAGLALVGFGVSQLDQERKNRERRLEKFQFTATGSEEKQRKRRRKEERKERRS